MLSFLCALPVIGGFVTYVKDNVRNLVDILLVAGLVALAAFAVVSHLRAKGLETKAEVLSTQVLELSVANASQTKALADLQEVRKKDSAATAGLVKRLGEINEATNDAKRRMAELEANNEQIRSYLDQPLPADVACVLNDGCKPGGADAGSESGTARNAAGGLRPSTATGVRNK